MVPSSIIRARLTRVAWLLPPLIALASAAAIIVAANAFFMRPTAAVLQMWDEGYALAFARRMLEGHDLPYVDGVSHRGPLFYWIVSLFVKVFGTGTFMPMRALGLVAMLLTVGLGFAAACAAGRSLAGGVMALAYVALCLTCVVGESPAEGIACHSEHPTNVFAMAALACMAMAMARRRQRGDPPLGWIAACGASLMACAMCKQVGLVLAVPFGCWVLALAAGRKDLPPRRRWAPVTVFAGAFLAPLVIVLARYAAAGELSTFYYYAVTYNTRIYVRVIAGDDLVEFFRALFVKQPELILVWAGLAGWGVTRAFVRARGLRDLARAYEANAFEAVVGLSALLTFTSANGTFRVWSHYYLQFIPWVALLGGLVVDRITRRVADSGHNVRAGLARGIVLLPLLGVTFLAWGIQLHVLRRDTGGQTSRMFTTGEWPVCKFIREETKPTDSIFVWGFDPVPYTSCDRRPASRFVFTTFVAGVVPWVSVPRELEETRIVPGSRELLLADLRADMPAVIVDSAETMMGRSMTDYPSLREFLDANYCKRPTWNEAGLWTRKPAEGTGACPSVEESVALQSPMGPVVERRPLQLLWSPRSQGAPLHVEARSAHLDSETAAADESLRDAHAAGYVVDETPGWEVPPAVFTAPVPGTVPLKLFFNPRSLDHFSTATPEGEAAALNTGCILLGVEGYVYDKLQPEALPLFLFYNPMSQDNLTTASVKAARDAVREGYFFVRIEGYVPRS